MGLVNMIGMKRCRDSEQFDRITAMANCLMLLSSAGGDQFQVLSSFTNQNHINPDRVFECKTCNRQFSSFQALGGHRASHKKPKLGGDLSLQYHAEASPAKPKTHECSICGQEFAVGQALGGHMRRHRAAGSAAPAAAAVSEDSNSDRDLDQSHKKRRLWSLDLNLTPLENDDLEFGLGKRLSAPVNCVS